MSRNKRIQIFRQGLTYENQIEGRRNLVHSITTLRRSRAIATHRVMILSKDPVDTPLIEFSRLSAMDHCDSDLVLLANLENAFASGNLYSVSNSIGALRDMLCKCNVSFLTNHLTAQQNIVKQMIESNAMDIVLSVLRQYRDDSIQVRSFMCFDELFCQLDCLSCLANLTGTIGSTPLDQSLSCLQVVAEIFSSAVVNRHCRIARNCICPLANLSDEHDPCGLYLLENECVLTLIQCLQSEVVSLSNLRCVSWLLCSIVKSVKDYELSTVMQSSLLYLVHLLSQSADPEVIGDVSMSCGHLIRSTNAISICEEILERGIAKRIFVLNSDSLNFLEGQTLFLQYFFKFGSSVQVQSMLLAGGLTTIYDTLKMCVGYDLIRADRESTNRLTSSVFSVDCDTSVTRGTSITAADYLKDILTSTMQAILSWIRRSEVDYNLFAESSPIWLHLQWFLLDSADVTLEIKEYALRQILEKNTANLNNEKLICSQSTIRTMKEILGLLISSKYFSLSKLSRIDKIIFRKILERSFQEDSLSRLCFSHIGLFIECVQRLEGDECFQDMQDLSGFDDNFEEVCVNEED